MSREGNDKIIFFDIKQRISGRGEEIEGGRHVKGIMIFYIYIY